MKKFFEFIKKNVRPIIFTILGLVIVVGIIAGIITGAIKLYGCCAGSPTILTLMIKGMVVLFFGLILLIMLKHAGVLFLFMGCSTLFNAVLGLLYGSIIVPAMLVVVTVLMFYIGIDMWDYKI